MTEKPYRTTYPADEKISTNKVTAKTYRKIRDCFKSHYIDDKKFCKPLWPKEEEFLQWIKKFLNEMEKGLKK